MASEYSNPEFPTLLPDSLRNSKICESLNTLSRHIGITPKNAQTLQFISKLSQYYYNISNRTMSDYYDPSYFLSDPSNTADLMIFAQTLGSNTSDPNIAYNYVLNQTSQYTTQLMTQPQCLGINGTLEFEDIFEYFATEKHMDDHVKSKPDSLALGIVFKEITNMTIDYAIKGHSVPSTNKPYILGNEPWPNYLILRHIGQYTKSGFYAWQMAIDQTFLRTLDYDVAITNKIGFHTFPFDSNEKDTFWTFLKQLLPIIIMISFSYPFVVIAKTIVDDKALRFKEYFCVLGGSNNAYLFSYMLAYLVLFSISNVLLTWVLVSNVFLLSSFSLIFALIEVFGFCMIAFGMFVGTIFDEPRLGSLVSCLLFLVLFYIHRFVEDSPDESTKNAICLSGPACFALALGQISEFESYQTGMDWDNWTKYNETKTFKLSTAFFYIFIDFVIYTFLMLYLDRVFPTKYGVRRPWYSPFEWMDYIFVFFKCCRNKMPHLQRFLTKDLSSYSIDKTKIENIAESVGTRAVLEILNLTKVFFNSSEASHNTAVNHLNLTTYQSQVFCLLGHNGAGKSTTVNMVTGMLSITGGDALLHNVNKKGEHLSVKTELSEIRKKIGLCPQHDVLFPSLTVWEHLQFYGQINGVPKGDELDAICNELINEIDLNEKKRFQSCMLSGGQKRKLSVCIAMVGHNALVILDEPTTGMDPFARRATWGFIKKYKKDRSIILTTHYMDEAEILSDTIGIMAQGQLMCCGSALFLKQQYNVGYALRISLQNGVKKVHSQSSKILKVVQHELNDKSVALIDQNARELVYKVSFESNDHLPALFRHFDENSDELQISKYSISATTLEEVFRCINGIGHDDNEEFKSAFEANTGSRLSRVDFSKSRQSFTITQDNIQSKTENKKLNKLMMLGTGMDLSLHENIEMIVQNDKNNEFGFDLISAPLNTSPDTTVQRGIVSDDDDDVINKQPSYISMTKTADDNAQIERETTGFLEVVDDMIDKQDSMVSITAADNDDDDDGFIRTQMSNLSANVTTVIDKQMSNLSITNAPEISKLKSPSPNVNSSASSYNNRYSMDNESKNRKQTMESKTLSAQSTHYPDFYDFGGHSSNTMFMRARMSVARQTNFIHKKSILASEKLPDGFTVERAVTLTKGFSASDDTGVFSDCYAHKMHKRSCVPCLNGYFWMHIWLQVVKRSINAIRDAKTFWCQCIVPSFAVILGLATFAIVWWDEPPEYYFNTNDFVRPNQELFIPYTRYNNITRASYYQTDAFINGILGKYANETGNIFVGYKTLPYQSNLSLPEWQDVLKNASEIDDSYHYLSLYFSQFLDTNVIIYGANLTSVHSFPIGLNLVSNYIAQTINETANIKCASHPFPAKGTASNALPEVINAVDAFFSALIITIGMIFVPAAYVAMLVEERVFMVKHQQLVSGMSVLSYWLGNFVFDVLTNIVPSTLCICYILAFDVSNFLGIALFPTWFVLVMYGFSVVPFTYLLSMTYPSAGSAQSFTAFLFFSTSVIAMSTAWVMDNTSSDSVNESNEILKWIYRLFPPYCLAESLQGIVTRNMTELHDGERLYIWHYDVIGRNLCIMFVECVVYFSLLLFYEYLSTSPRFLRFFSKNYDMESFDSAFSKLDDDVVQEKVEMKAENTQHPIEIQGLYKVYAGAGDRPPILAVRDMWYRVKKGEVFGFLGLNGAGKTTTLSMLSGIYAPTFGSAFINGHPISDQTAVRMSLGYCPQFSALFPRLTVQEHLEFFARIKGIKNENHKRTLLVKQLICDLGLEQYTHRAAARLSGGNQRKLSIGMALIGNPPVVILDEPTAGMDPISRRSLWDFISSTMTGRSVILTTHSMEECDALCDRIGIMIKGQLACLGDKMHLKQKFGIGYQLDIKFDIGVAYDPTNAMNDNDDGIRNKSMAFVHCNKLTPYLEEAFGGKEYVTLLETYANTARYQVGHAQLSIADVFEQIEEIKIECSIADYAVSGTTLEQIFLKFANAQKKMECAIENKKNHSKKMKCIKVC